MKTIHIVALVVGSMIITFMASVIFSINMVSISPKNLAKVIQEDPAAFIEAVQKAGETHQKQSQAKALEQKLKNPEDIPTKGRVTFGDPEAPVKIVEFADFQCSFCARQSPEMKALIKKYDGKVNLVFKHFPLSFHPFAKPAAEYFEALALVDPKKAKEFHDGIFDNFSDYGRLKGEDEIEESLKKLVKKLDVQQSSVEENMEKAKEVVKADMEEGRNLKVPGTPSFFVNGVKVGRRDRIEDIIDHFLKKGDKKK